MLIEYPLLCDYTGTLSLAAERQEELQTCQVPQLAARLQRGPDHVPDGHGE